MSRCGGDSEKLPDASHRWHRTMTMASTKVGADLTYYAYCSASEKND